jgi:hypothetical protein
MQRQQRPEVDPIRENLILRERYQQGWLGSQLVRQGTVAVVLRNGRVHSVIGPGRKLVLRLPFQQIEVLLIDTKIRNLNIVSKGEFLTVDKWRVNVSLWVSYRVTNAPLIAVEYAQPVHALYSTVKDMLGQVISQSDFQTLSQTGRQVVRQQILGGTPQVEQTLGMALTDVRVDDLTLPDRVGSAFDERQVAQMEGEAAQWRLRGKWQDMPDSVRRSHMQERLVDGAMFVNPPLPGSVVGQGGQGYPQVPGGQGYPQVPGAAPDALPPGGQVVDSEVARTHILSGEVWGQLVVVGGPKEGVIFPLRQPAVTIGRAGDNDIVLQDISVSGRHARIEQRGTQVFVVDMNSSNGTLVNGQRVQQVQLSGGETIRLGDTSLRIEMLR